MKCHKRQELKIWIPDSFQVVLGSGNKSDMECNVEACNQYGIPILKRYGGGGTVLLHPQCVIVSYGTWVTNPYNNSEYFNKINSAIIQSLALDWFELGKLHQAGISDIAFENKKICGTSMFRSRNYLLYQASILVETNIELIEKFLQHPSKEPDYRQGKSHRSFLASLHNINESITCEKVSANLSTHLPSCLEELLTFDFIEPQENQMKYLLKRASNNV